MCDLRSLAHSFPTAHAAALASFGGAYTAAHRLAVNPAAGCRDETKYQSSCSRNIRSPDSTSSQRDCCVVVEVQFSGPQSAERPALLLKRLFQAEKVAGYPVALRRGRKRSPEAENKDVLGERNEESRASARVPKSSQQGKGNNRSLIPPVDLAICTIPPAA